MIDIGRIIVNVRAPAWILKHAEYIDEAMKIDVEKMAQNMVRILIFGSLVSLTVKVIEKMRQTCGFKPFEDVLIGEIKDKYSWGIEALSRFLKNIPSSKSQIEQRIAKEFG